MRMIHRSLCGSLARFSHLSMSQNTSAVQNDEKA
jgi:hypothetical protein